MSKFIGFVVVDVDAKVSLVERLAYAAAQTIQNERDFEQAWGIEGLTVRVSTPEAPPLKTEIQIRLLDKPTLDGALGYHDMLDDGTPIAYVFVGLARTFGDVWTSIASHEVLELLADPFLRKSVQTKDGFEDLEICDRVERDSYTIDGVLLSNFNTPECFEPPNTLEGVKFDFLGLSTVPDQVRPGGYKQRFDPSKGWIQINNGSMSAYRSTLSALNMTRGKRRTIVTPRPTFWKRLISAFRFGK